MLTPFGPISTDFEPFGQHFDPFWPILTLFGRELETIGALEGPKKARRPVGPFLALPRPPLGHPRREGVTFWGILVWE